MRRRADGIRMVTDVGEFWLHSGRVVEGRQWLGEFVDRSDEDVPMRERAAALVWMAQLGDDNMLDDAAASSALFAHLEDGLALARSIGDYRLELRALSFLSQVLTSQDRMERAVAFADEGIARAAQLGERWWLGELSLRAAVLAHWRADRERAATLAVEACDLADEVGNQRLAIECRMTLAFVAPGTAHASAAPRLAEILPLAEDLGDRRALAWFYPALAFEALHAGRTDDAAKWIHTGLETARDLGWWRAVALGMMGAQQVAMQHGRWGTAAHLYGALSSRRPMLPSLATPQRLKAWERTAVSLRGALGDDAFDARVREGSRLAWDDAASEAIDVCRVDNEPLVARSQPPVRDAQASEPLLTERELDVLRLIAAGDSNKEVAAALGITAKTVMHHSVAIYRKLGVRGRAEATAYAFRHRLDAPQVQR
jgi:DNA-binding CsgD family transcriptional regulator